MDYPHMPTVNHGSEKANKFFLDVAKYWLDPDQDGDYTDGIDGWRCDYAIGTPEAFWRSMRAELKALNSNVLLLGEVWVKEPSGQTGYFKDAFDAQFDFPLYFVLEGDPAISQDGLIAGKSLVSLATQRIEAGRSLFDPESLLVRFINNHDMDRSASEAGGDPQRERLGALLVACLDGVPMIYYGEEIGMLGKRGSGPYFDEYRREPMEWNVVNNSDGTTYWLKDPLYIQNNDGISVAEQDNKPESLLNYYRAIYKIRRDNPALLTGEYQQMVVSPANSQVWAFWRYSKDQITGIFFNFGDTEAVIQPDLQNAPANKIGESVELFHTGRYVKEAGAIQLAPASAVIFDFTD
jgi:glycosidase